ALASSYGPVAAFTTASGTAMAIAVSPTKVGERGDQGTAALTGAEEAAARRARGFALPPVRPVDIRRRVRSGGAGAPEHGGNRAQQNLEIQAQRPAVDVEKIHLDPTVEIDGVATAHLPETGHARAHRQPTALRALHLARLVDRERARPHQAHLPPQDVQQLGQLI